MLIAHSGRTTSIEVQRALEAGFDRHLAKPLPGTELCELIAAFLGDHLRKAGQPPKEMTNRPTSAAAEHASHKGQNT